MKITSSAKKEILKEYDERLLKERRELEERRAEVKKKIPEYGKICDEISSLYVENAINRIKRADFKNAPPSSDNKKTNAGATSKAAEEENPNETLTKKLSDLNDKKEALLKNAGYDASYVEMAYSCPICKDTGYADGQECSCFKKRLSEYLYGASNIKNILQKENFSAFTYDFYSDEVKEGEGESPRQMAKNAAKKALAFIKGFDKKRARGLFIYGECGTGKTFLSNCVAKELIDRGNFVLYLSAVRFFEILAAQTFSRDPETAEQAEYIYDCDLLIIDDLGTEIPNKFTQTGLFDVLNERTLAGKSTIISANFNIEELQNKYSERIASRILSGYELLKLTGDDIRLKKKLEE